MNTRNAIFGGLLQPTALRISPGGSTATILQRDGSLIQCNLSGQHARIAATAPPGVRKMDLADKNQTAMLVGGRPGLIQINLGNGQAAKVIARNTLFSAVHVNSDNDTIYLTEAHFDGRLLAFSRRQSRMKVLAKHLRAPRAILAQRTTGKVFVADAALGGQVLVTTRAGRLGIVASDLGAPIDMAWRNRAQTQLLVADAQFGRILLLDLTQPLPSPQVLYDRLPGLFAVQALSQNKLVIGADNGIWLGSLVPTRPSPVEFRFPPEPLFVAGWVRVPVVINDPAISFDDLAFSIKPEEAAAAVSPSRDNGFDPAHPEIIVIAGWKIGEHRLSCTHVPTGNVVGDMKFEVTDTWTDDTYGPSLSVLGSILSGPTAGTFGGGDFTKPQNLASVPALGTRNVGLVLVDTADARYPTGAALTTLLNDFQNEMVNGVPVSGQNRSVATYYDQASNGDLTLNVQAVVGTVSLPGNWGTYFIGTTQTDAVGKNWTQWTSRGTYVDTVSAEIVQLNENAAAAGNPVFLDLTTIDTLVIVTRSVPPGDRFSWAEANIAPNTHIIGHYDLGWIKLSLFRSFAAIMIADDWPTHPYVGRRWHETVAHELGHNLQLNDQYFQSGFNPAYRPRIADNNPTNSWELMSWEEDLPLPSACHRLMLGWLDKSWIKLFNFAVFGRADETFTLHACSAGDPPAGEFAAAEIRIADGRNYYLEYRPATLGRIIDSNPPAGVTVFGSDTTSRGCTPADRPEILRLREDGDADHSEFQSGDDYEEADTTSPQFPNDLVVNVISTTNTSATVRVRYGLDSLPDPAITPWSASTNWQSPDIEVRNARSQADPDFFNIPWEGHDNTVIARITNRGQLPANGVRVRFGALDFTFAGGAESPLGDRVDNVPTAASVDFQAPVLWRPVQLSLPFLQFTFQQHACLVARIDPYVNGTIREVTPDNNTAQSNYSWMATTTASPASRQVTVINATNTLTKPACVSIEIWQPHPLFRVYLSHRWVRLDPGASAPILVMVESLLGDPSFAPLVEKHSSKEARIATTLRLSALANTGETCTSTVLGGVSIKVITGRATRFDKFSVDGNLAQGKIVAVDSGQGVNGKVLISIRPRDPADRRAEIVREVSAAQGIFRVELGVSNDELKYTTVQGHYLGDFQYTPCDSDEVGF